VVRQQEVSLDRMAATLPTDAPFLAADGPGPVWQAHRGVPAWLLSLGLHFVALTALALSTAQAPQGAADETVRSGGIVLVQRTEGKAEYFADDDGHEAPAASSAASRVIEAAPSPFPDYQAPPLTAGPQLPTTAETIAGSEAQAGMPSAGHFAEPGKSRGGRVGQGQNFGVETEVFGVTGRGSKFVYVFDRSASMASFSGRPLAGAKRELIASLQSLESVHQFQVIFYNDKPELMTLVAGQRPGLVFADERGKQLAANYIGGIYAYGGTQHMPALRLALQMKPDVIFFLTDADPPELTRNDLDAIGRLNRGTVINAIEFGTAPQPPRHNFLKQVAQENDGQYGYVNIMRLPLP
jgi:hypothetical protein